MVVMRRCEPVDLDFVHTAPIRFDNSAVFPITSQQLFDVIADDDALPRWATVIANATRTSPGPRGVGSTRTVRMRGGIVGDEEFLAWRPHARITFRLNECSLPVVAAFVEDYRIEPTPGGCRLTWTLAQKGRGPWHRALAVATPATNLMYRRFLRNLRRYTDQRFANAHP